jgi:phosphoglycolate phosphatase
MSKRAPPKAAKSEGPETPWDADPKPPAPALFVTDIDNTLFDWVAYYVASFTALLKQVEAKIQVPYAALAEEAKVVFEKHGSIEYPFVVQEMPSVLAFFGDDIDGLLTEGVRPARDAFNKAAEAFLRPYEGVNDALAEVKRRHPKTQLIALTDAPRYVAMWKLNKLGILHTFDAVYGLPDPRIPTSDQHGRVKVDPEILLKHLQQNNFGFKGKIRILPEDYEKPGTKGLKTVLMDYEMDENPAVRQQVVWVGDNQRKDVGLGRRLGVRTAWAAYGVPKVELLKLLNEFSPPLNIHKNAAVPLEPGQSAPKADYELDTFADILKYV